MRKSFLILFVFSSYMSFGQYAFVEKENKDEGSYLLIVINYKDSVRKYSPGCMFKEVTMLPDSTKIRLIGELLSYAKDTSICYTPIQALTNHYYGKETPVSKRYNMQIEALVYINYIALSIEAFNYNPYPLLYDRVTNKEIFCSGEVLDKVIVMYKKWYEKLKQHGFYNYGLPLWGEQFYWFGSLMRNLKADLIIKEYPKWKDYYSCPLWED